MILQQKAPISEEVSFLEMFQNACKTEFGEDAFNKWLSSLKINANSTNEVVFSVNSKFIRDWILREYVENKKLNKLVAKIDANIKKLSVIYIQEENVANNNYVVNTENKVANITKQGNIFTLGTELNSRFTFDNFVDARYNKLALSMSKIAAGIDKQTELFDDKIPLFIHGGVGMGKTHLAQAIAWQVKEYNPEKRVVYLSAEKFMYHFVQSIRNNDVMSFKEKMRSIDVLIVDDVQFIAGKESTQQEFMNSFNSLVEDNKQVILVCDRCPLDLENIDEKLKSRISGGMIVNFKTPDYKDRINILETKAKLLDQEICPKIISFIAEKITGSVRDLEGALKKLIAQKLLLDEEITIDSVKNMLSDYIRNSKSNSVTVEKIQKTVATFYGIKTADLSSKSRARTIARPRQIAMYLCKNLTLESLPKIGAKFGGKNHATVIHSVKLIKEKMNADNKILQEVKQLEEKLM